ncbi:cold shock domain-containing protein [Bradyrhizobium elkanii]
MRIKGQIIRWFPERGFGFAKMHADDRRDIFVHTTHISEGAPFVGAEVTFELAEDGHGRRLANKVRVTSSRIAQ